VVAPHRHDAFYQSDQGQAALKQGVAANPQISKFHPECRDGGALEAIRIAKRRRLFVSLSAVMTSMPRHAPLRKRPNDSAP
jgi:hypothetical protein